MAEILFLWFIIQLVTNQILLNIGHSFKLMEPHYTNQTQKQSKTGSYDSYVINL